MHELGLVGQEQQVDDDTRRVEQQRTLDRTLDKLAEVAPRPLGAVDVGDVGAQHERRLPRPGNPLQQRRLPRRELDRVGAGLDERGDRRLHVLDPGEEGGLAEEAVVDGDVEALAVGGEEPVQARGHATTSSILGSPSAAPTAVVAAAPTLLAKTLARSSDQPWRRA